jgi:hypothetical protein
MSNPRPFPKVAGGCYCKKTRYLVTKPPLFCHACHCPDCQKATGSVFGCFATVESTAITQGPIPPRLTKNPLPHGKERCVASCAECGTSLWTTGEVSPAIASVKVGTLDHPMIMEPDCHAFVGSRMPWVGLPEGARTTVGAFNMREMWPASSLVRLDGAIRKYEESLKGDGTEGEKQGKEQAEKQGGKQEREQGETEQGKQEEKKANREAGTETEEADKTPTAQTPEEKEDDDEFEKRFQATEKALQERLEKLTLKLQEQESA